MLSEALLLAAIGGLASAVGYLHRVVEKRLADCEDDRRNLWECVRSLQVSQDVIVDELEGDE